MCQCCLTHKMESTPIIENSAESPVHGVNDDTLNTPLLYSSLSRKRKIMATAKRLQGMTLYEPEPSPVLYYMSPMMDTNVRSIFTSTLNDSRIATQFSGDTSSFYSTASTPYDACKRKRISPGMTVPKSRSAPSTPTRDSSCERSANFSKSHSYHFTPSKRYVPAKIETPEKFKILYPQLKEVKTPVKPKTPQKLREMIQDSTPAKKRLFSRDPVEQFSVLSCNDDIVRKIFSYLCAEDLIQVQGVSRLWRRLVREDRRARNRCAEYINAVEKEKENRYHILIKADPNMSLPSNHASPPPSPNSINHMRFKKAAEKLDSSQELSKCLECNHPAVKQGYICQCVNVLCGYIWCQNCMSSTAHGPRHFKDRCARSELLAVNSLSDISNSMDCTPSFLFSASSNHSLISDSSGYGSMNETGNTTGKMKALRSHNIASMNVQRASLDVQSVSTVRLLTPKCRRTERDGSTSPRPKVHVIGSATSRKNLRRLF